MKGLKIPQGDKAFGGHQSLSEREESSAALLFWKYGVKMTK
jgi:hypothetical protein